MSDEKPDVEIDADTVEVKTAETDVADGRNDPDDDSAGDAGRSDEIDDPDVESGNVSDDDPVEGDTSMPEAHPDDDDEIDDASDPDADPKPAT